MPRSKLGGWPYSNPPNTQFTLNTQSTQARGLVGWWPTLGQYGNTATVRDYVANRFPMTQYNTPTWQNDGVFGEALLYDDAATEYLEVAASPVASEPFSFSAWYKTNDLGANQVLLSLGDSGSGLYYALILTGNVAAPYDGYVTAWAFDGDLNSLAFTSMAFSANVWQHAVAVFASNGSIKVYVNGGHVGTSAVAHGAITINQIAIGVSADGTPSNYMSGQISDARLYNRALTAAEIWQMYDPATRWELYKPVMPDMLGFAGGVTIPLFMHHYRQLRIGNGF